MLLYNQLTRCILKFNCENLSASNIMEILVQEFLPVFCYCLLLTQKHSPEHPVLENVQSVSFLQPLNYL